MKDSIIITLIAIFSLVFELLASRSWIPTFETFNVLAFLILIITMVVSKASTSNSSLWITKYAKLTLIIVAMAFAAWYPLMDRINEINIDRGSSLVRKIEDYKNQHGYFPTMENYISEIKPAKTILGDEFIYSVGSDSSSYELYFYAFRGLSGIHTGGNEWIFDY